MNLLVYKFVFSIGMFGHLDGFNKEDVKGLMQLAADRAKKESPKEGNDYPRIDRWDGGGDYAVCAGGNEQLERDFGGVK